MDNQHTGAGHKRNAENGCEATTPPTPTPIEQDNSRIVRVGNGSYDALSGSIENMVVAVVLLVMHNRSDRRFTNLSCAWASRLLRWPGESARISI